MENCQALSPIILRPISQRRISLAPAPISHGLASRNGRPSGFNPKRLATILENVHDRRAGGVIKSLPWRDFIDRCDRLGMPFYLAPPYRGAEGSYGKGLFRRDEFAEPAAWPAGEMVRAGSLGER